MPAGDTPAVALKPIGRRGAENVLFGMASMRASKKPEATDGLMPWCANPLSLSLDFKKASDLKSVVLGA